MVAQGPKRICIYCGSPTKKGRKGEHIFQDAIGGVLTLNDFPNRAVCQKCNSAVLSNIDRELCCRSFLSAVASQKLKKDLWQAWEVDDAANCLLLEARPVWAADEILNSLVCYPQITFEPRGPEVRGDAEEFLQFGQEAFPRVLFKAVRHCFARHRAGEKGALHFERIRSGVIHDGYRLAPRIFTRHSISEIAQNINKQEFVLRFVTEEDKRHALNCLSNLGEGRDFNSWGQKPGSRNPTLCFFFDIGDTLRALMKIGLNVIAAYCPNTPINSETFKEAINIITGKTPVPPRLIKANGFAFADDIQDFSGNANEHACRLIHDEGAWQVFLSFFGGNIGAYVRIPGPNYEDWRWGDIVAPIKSKEWRITKRSIIPLVKVRFAWHGCKEITPSLKLQKSISSMHAELARRA